MKNLKEALNSINKRGKILIVVIVILLIFIVTPIIWYNSSLSSISKQSNNQSYKLRLIIASLHSIHFS